MAIGQQWQPELPRHMRAANQRWWAGGPELPRHKWATGEPAVAAGAATLPKHMMARSQRLRPELLGHKRAAGQQWQLRQPRHRRAAN